MATHFSILTWRIPWTEEPSSPWGHKESDMTEQLNNNIKQRLGFILIFPFGYLFDPAPLIEKVVFDKFLPVP